MKSEENRWGKDESPEKQMTSYASFKKLYNLGESVAETQGLHAKQVYVFL